MYRGARYITAFGPANPWAAESLRAVRMAGSASGFESFGVNISPTVRKCAISVSCRSCGLPPPSIQAERAWKSHLQFLDGSRAVACRALPLPQPHFIFRASSRSSTSSRKSSDLPREFSQVCAALQCSIIRRRFPTVRAAADGLDIASARRPILRCRMVSANPTCRSLSLPFFARLNSPYVFCDLKIERASASEAVWNSVGYRVESGVPSNFSRFS